MLCVTLLSGTKMSGILLSVTIELIMLGGIMLSVVMLTVVILGVAAPTIFFCLSPPSFILGCNFRGKNYKTFFTPFLTPGS